MHRNISGACKIARRHSTALQFFLLLLCFAPAFLPAASAQSKAEKPVAVAGKEKFYEQDFLPQLQSELYKLRMQEYQLKRKALEEAIGKKLLQAEAEKLGTTPEELLKKDVDSKVDPPSDQEVEEEFVRQMFQNGGGATQDKDKVREQLVQEFSQDARDQYFETLRQQAGVKILLVPPKIEVAPDPTRMRGNPDAKITIVEFSDFQCPYCLQAYTTVKDLLKKYDGKIKLSYRDLPLQETQGKIPGTGEAARCALEQGKFWEYHDLLFENQDSYGASAFRDFAESLKLDGDKFAACLDSGKYKAPVHADFEAAMRLGIKGTPAFFIDGVPLSGARPQSDFEEILDAELAALEP